METLKHNVTFKVSLSNGETFYEGKAPFDDIPGKKSPWQRLIDYTVEKGVSITSLSLITKDNRTFNLPSSGKNPRFKAFSDADKPIDFQVKRSIAQDLTVSGNPIGGVELFTIAEAIYSTYTLQIWIDEQNTKNCWTLVVRE